MESAKSPVTKVLRSKRMDGPHKRNATYADVQALPDGKHGELIDGDLYIFGRPRVRHSLAVGNTKSQLAPAERDRRKGWVILFEVEIWLDAKRRNLVVPDLAGWRRERMPEVPDVQTIDLVPDWVCEGLSPSTARHDKGRKREKYAQFGVGHIWYADPKNKTLEILTLKRGSYHLTTVTGGNEQGVFAPFDFEIDVSMIWAR